MNTRKTVWIAVGGSGGHLFPAKVCADELARIDPQLQIVFIGEGLSKNPFFEKQFPFVDVSSATLSKKNFWKLPNFIFHLVQGLFQTLAVCKNGRPDLVIGFGSFHSLPPLCIATCMRIPFVLFEPNAIMGRVNRFFSKYAAQVFHGIFPIEIAAQAVAMPLDKQRLQKLCKTKAKQYYGLDPQIPVILIFGGSQGAKTMNFLAVEALMQVKKKGKQFQVLHLLGPNTDKHAVESRYQAHAIPACVLEFETDMQWAYSAADLALARSGASAVAELLAHQIPSIFMPYPFVEEDHQRKNAQCARELYQFGYIVEQTSHAASDLSAALWKLLDSYDKDSIFQRNIADDQVTLAEAAAKILNQIGVE